jgi:hypothetical protein
MKKRAIKISFFYFALILSAANRCIAESNDVPKQKPLWKTILSYDNWMDQGPAVMKISDGYLVAGLSSYMADKNFQRKVILWKIDTQGKELWVKDLNLPVSQNSKPFFPERSFSLPDEPTLLLVAASDIKARLLRFDNTGEVVFTKEFSSKQVFDIQGMRKTSDGMLLYGSAHKGQGNSDARVTKLDPNGNEIWTREYDKGKMEWGTGLAPQRDGGFILSADSGTYNKFGGGPSQAWIIKCGPDGNIVNETVFEGRHPSVIINGKITAVILNKENFPQQDIAIIGMDEDFKICWKIDSLFGKLGGMGMLSAIINKKGNFIFAGDKFGVNALWEINKEGKILGAVEIESTEQFIHLDNLFQTPGGYLVAGGCAKRSEMPRTAEGKRDENVQWDTMDILVAEVAGP